MNSLLSLLDSLGITYQRHDHAAVFTCRESGQLGLQIEGADTKNLFLRDGKGKRHFLVSVPHAKQVDLKALAGVLGSNGLGFASPERLKKYLGVEPGSVTLLGVVNDAEHAVEVVIDASIWQSEIILCHPLVNTSTLAIQKQGLERLFTHTGHVPRIIEVPERAGELLG
jgi:Ala-tRNA(Pro) deacylase